MKRERTFHARVRRGARPGGIVALLAVLAFGPDRVRAGDATAAARPPRREIVYAGDARFPPYEYLDAGGKPAGLNVDLIRAVAREQGLSVRVRLEPWAQVRANLASGAADVAAMYRSAQRAREVEFAIPHELIYHEMFVRRGSPAVTSLAGLHGKKVLVEGGTFSADALTELGFAEDLLPRASEPDALRDLARGQGEVAVVTQAVNRPFQDRAELQREVVATGPPVLLTEYAFVTQKGRRELIELLNQGVAAVKASGEYERIYDRWLRSGRLSAQQAGAIAWAALGLALAVLLVVVWNGSLRRRVSLQTQALRREFEEKERAQAALAETERSLRTSQKMEAIGRLAGGVAHDFNNILSVLLSYGTSLRETLAARGMETGDVDEMLAASERATRLTKQMLAFSRATPVDAVQLDLCAVVLEMRSMIQRLVGEHIRLETATPGHPVMVDAEATQVEQILINLAANARDAMPEAGTLLVTVQTRELPEGNRFALPAGEIAALSVADTGVGMDQDTLGRVFEPFFTTKEPGRGTGLGLAIVFGQVERLGGKISVESVAGSGSTFLVLLPSSRLRGAPAPGSGASSRSAPAISGHDILLVEDDDALRRAARLALEGAGHRVVEARDGEVALETASRLTLSILITDVVMPRRSGPSLAAELRRRRQDLLVLYVSGYVQSGERLDLDAPRTGFLAKPYTAHALVEALHRLISASAPPRRAADG